MRHHSQFFHRKANHRHRNEWRSSPQGFLPSLVSILLVALFVVLGLTGCRQGEERAEQPRETFPVAVPLRPGYTAFFVGIDKGYFHEEGLDLTLKPVPTGQGGLKALLAGEVQASGAADTPIVSSVLQGDQITVIATLCETQQATAIIAKKESGITAPTDLKGKTIGVTRGTAAEFFLHIYLVANNITPSEVQIVDIEPDRIVAALLEGGVKAVCTWSPYKLVLLEKLGPEAVIFTDPALYLQTFNLVTMQDLVKSKPETIGKLLRGVLRANDFIKMNPTEAQMIMAKHIGAESDIYQKEWPDYSFMAVLDQSLILNLEDQARWMLEKSADSPVRTPNFIDFIHVDPLRKVQPEAVRIFGR